MKKFLNTLTNSDFISKCSNYICDLACKNRACGHTIFANFFKLSLLITFYNIMLLQCNFQLLSSI